MDRELGKDVKSVADIKKVAVVGSGFTFLVAAPVVAERLVQYCSPSDFTISLSSTRMSSSRFWQF
jgi:hypothetical protein